METETDLRNLRHLLVNLCQEETFEDPSTKENVSLIFRDVAHLCGFHHFNPEELASFIMQQINNSPSLKFKP